MAQTLTLNLTLISTSILPPPNVRTQITVRTLRTSVPSLKRSPAYGLPTWRNGRRGGSWSGHVTRAEGGALGEGESEATISLGTMELAENVDLERLRVLMFQWASSLTQNANLPLPTPLKVDRLDSGVRLSYIQVREGVTEVLVNIDVTVTSAAGGRPAMFRAVRGGPLKAESPPGEAALMGSMKAALIKSLAMSRKE